MPDIHDVKSIIERHLASYTEKDRFVEVAFFGGNFTGLPVQMQDDFMKIVQPYLENGQVDGIRCSTRPDYIDANRVKILKKMGMRNIELGAQTTNDLILEKCGRGHSFSDIEKASQIIVGEGITLGLQMMLGLPFDSFEDDMQTARDIVRLGASETRIYPCVVVADTELERLYRSGEYSPLSINDAVEQSATLYEYFTDNNVNVLRVGLHTSDDLNGAAYVAGPYHNNFAEMVFSRIWGRRFEKIAGKTDSLRIEVPEGELNHAIGYKAENKKKLLERYKKVEIVPSIELTEGFNVCSSRSDSREVSGGSVHKDSMIIIASATMPEEAKQSLSKMGKVLWLEPSDKAYPSISAHPDIFFFCKDERCCNSVICAENVDMILPKGVNFVKGESSVGKKYPDTCHYNAVGVGDMLFHNLKHTDAKILEVYRKISTKSVQLNVNQGYTRCNLLALDDNNFITSDLGIKRVLEENRKNVFFVDPCKVILPGHEHGFFPGCCGLVGDSVVVCGSLGRLRECKELRKFIRRNGMKIIELYNGDLVDVGSIFFIRNKA